jgi:predicted DNA binding CopG/RHH family protein
MKKLKKIPEFKNEEEERAFWEEHDSSEYVNWDAAKTVTLPNLKKSTKSISLRLPADMLEKLKIKANAMDVPYQSYIKMLLQKELSAS